jgi:hypothetical protein
MPTIATKDGQEIRDQDRGKNVVVTVSHGWPQGTDTPDERMLFPIRDTFGARPFSSRSDLSSGGIR